MGSGDETNDEAAAGRLRRTSAYDTTTGTLEHEQDGLSTETRIGGELASSPSVAMAFRIYNEQMMGGLISTSRGRVRNLRPSWSRSTWI